jgi:hypothetical protein
VRQPRSGSNAKRLKQITTDSYLLAISHFSVKSVSVIRLLILASMIFRVDNISLAILPGNASYVEPA